MLRHRKKHAKNQLSNNNSTGNSASDMSDEESSQNPPPQANPQQTPKIPDLISKDLLWKLAMAKDFERQASGGGHQDKRNDKPQEGTVDDHGSDLIGNLLGISDRGILNKLLSSADEAAKLLGVKNNE